MFYCGIDIAKYRHEATVIDQAGAAVQESISFVSATWQADTLAVFVKVIFLFGFRCPCAALVKGAHSQHDMTMGIAAVGVVNGKVHAHSSGNKLRGTVFPDKPDLFLSGQFYGERCVNLSGKLGVPGFLVKLHAVPQG